MSSTSFLRRSVGVSLLLSFASCAPLDGHDVEERSDALQAESSYVSDAVLTALRASPGMQGRTWNVSHDNRFESGFLLRTPMQDLSGRDLNELSVATCTTNCDADFQRQRCNVQSDCTGGGTCRAVPATVKTPGEAPQKLCTAHSDALVDEIYGLLTSATKIADVTSLTPPDGPFEAGVRNAITFLSKRPNPPRVRLIFGTFPVQGVVNTTTLIKNLTRDVAKSSPIDVAVGAYRSSDLPPSWNHSKIVAVDGKDAIVGGHNLWAKHYLNRDPVHDLSMRVRGSAAGDAQRFANDLWNYACTHMTWSTWLTWSVWVNKLENGKVITGCPAPFDLPRVEGASTGTVISIGRLGTGIANDGNQSDAALRALMGSARHTLRISQQDIGPVTVPVIGIPIGGWPDAELTEIAKALARGVEVFIVLSNPNASAGGLSRLEAQYANGWTPADIGRRIQGIMEKTAGMPKGAALRALLCEKLHLTTLSYGGAGAWPSGVPFASHDKTLSVDEQAFYIGSQNMYPAGLQEFGYLVDDSRATAAYLSNDWDVLWSNSEASAVSGAGAPTCAL